MRYVIRLIVFVFCVSGWSVHGIEGPPNAGRQVNNIQTVYNLYHVEQHINYLLKAFDPFTDHSDEPIYAFLQKLSKNYPDMYVLLQDVYRVVSDKYMKIQKLQSAPLFSVLSDESVQNVILHGSESGQGGAKQRKRVQDRFTQIARLIVAAADNKDALNRVLQQDECNEPQNMIAFLIDDAYVWWKDMLDEFHDKGRGDYIKECADVIDQVLRDINAYRVPVSFALYTMPRMLSELAEKQHEEVREAIVADDQEQQDMADELKKQIDDAEQKQRQKTDQGKFQMPSGGLLEEIRKGAELRAPRETVWWNERLRRLEDDLLQEGDASKQEVKQVVQVLDRIMHNINAQRATQWFQDTAFEAFLQVLQDEEARGGLIENESEVRKYLANIMGHTGETSQLDQFQERQYITLTQESSFKRAFPEAEESDDSDEDE